MNTHSQNQVKFEMIVQELQKKIEEKQGKTVNLFTITQELKGVKQGMSNVDQRLNGALKYISS